MTYDVEIFRGSDPNRKPRLKAQFSLDSLHIPHHCPLLDVVVISHEKTVPKGFLVIGDSANKTILREMGQ